MSKESLPAFPKLLVHRSVHIMKVNCLERFQELIGGMKKTRPLFDGKRADIFQTYPPDSFQFSVLHQWFGHVAQGRGRRVLGGKFGNTRASMDLQRQV